MDVLWFFERRTAFTRFYYETSAQTWLEIQRKIKDEEPPFDDPPWDDSGEPPFVSEWGEAEDGLTILGRSCVSMLASSMQLYFKAWESELGIKMDDKVRKRIFRKGILKGYRVMFEHFTKVPWCGAPSNLEILEQVTLARNDDQHGGHITTVHAEHDRHNRARFGERLLFVSDMDRKIWQHDPETVGNLFFGTHVIVTKDALFTAIQELETLVRWLEPQFIELKWGKKGRAAYGREQTGDAGQ